MRRTICGKKIETKNKSQLNVDNDIFYYLSDDLSSVIKVTVIDTKITEELLVYDNSNSLVDIKLVGDNIYITTSKNNIHIYNLTKKELNSNLLDGFGISYIKFIEIYDIYIYIIDDLNDIYVYNTFQKTLDKIGSHSENIRSMNITTENVLYSADTDLYYIHNTKHTITKHKTYTNNILDIAVSNNNIYYVLLDNNEVYDSNNNNYIESYYDSITKLLSNKDNNYIGFNSIKSVDITLQIYLNDFTYFSDFLDNNVLFVFTTFFLYTVYKKTIAKYYYSIDEIYTIDVSFDVKKIIQ